MRVVEPRDFKFEMEVERKHIQRRRIIAYRNNGRSLSEDRSRHEDSLQPLTPEILLKCETITSAAHRFIGTSGLSQRPIDYRRLPKLNDSTQLVESVPSCTLQPTNFRKRAAMLMGNLPVLYNAATIDIRFRNPTDRELRKTSHSSRNRSGMKETLWPHEQKQPYETIVKEFSDSRFTRRGIRRCSPCDFSQLRIG